MESIILLIAAKLGISPELLPVYLGVLIAVSNLLGKSIPASATGPLGIVRKVALVVGLYIPQRLTPGVTTKNVAAAIAAEVPDAVIKAGSDQLKEAVATGVATGVVSSQIREIARHTPQPIPATTTSREGPML